MICGKSVENQLWQQVVATRLDCLLMSQKRSVMSVRVRKYDGATTTTATTAAAAAAATTKCFFKKLKIIQTNLNEMFQRLFSRLTSVSQMRLGTKQQFIIDTHKVNRHSQGPKLICF